MLGPGFSYQTPVMQQGKLHTWYKPASLVSRCNPVRAGRFSVPPQCQPPSAIEPTSVTFVMNQYDSDKTAPIASREYVCSASALICRTSGAPDYDKCPTATARCCARPVRLPTAEWYCPFQTAGHAGRRRAPCSGSTKWPPFACHA